jgi:hypothetical protein
MCRHFAKLFFSILLIDAVGNGHGAKLAKQGEKPHKPGAASRTRGRIAVEGMARRGGWMIAGSYRKSCEMGLKLGCEASPIHSKATDSLLVI